MFHALNSFYYCFVLLTEERQSNVLSLALLQQRHSDLPQPCVCPSTSIEYDCNEKGFQTQE